MQISAVNILAVHVLAVNRPLPLHTVSKSVICTLNSAKKACNSPYTAPYTRPPCFLGFLLVDGNFALSKVTYSKIS